MPIKPYDHTTYPTNGALGSSSALRNELDAIETGFDMVATEIETALTGATGAATTAITKAGEALTSANNADISEAAAAASAAAALVSKNAAADSETNAAASATAVANTYDAFDDRYLGTKAVAPTLDNDGNALQQGTLYWDSALVTLRGYNGAAWVNLPATTASNVVNIPAGNLSATDVQAALNELQSDIDTRATSLSVASQISALVDSSPATLDTLNELAAALGDDPNFATTITNALGLKSPINSPTFTGTPAAPTAAAATNTTQLATTAFVQNAVTAVATPEASETVSGKVELATTAEVIAGTDTVRAVTPASMKAGLNASGNAPTYACRAWVNFNGTGTVAIRASGNVSSITDNGTGDYSINLTAMADANYSAVVTAGRGAGDTQGNIVNITDGQTSSQFRILIRTRADVITDQAQITCAVFR